MSESECFTKHYSFKPWVVCLNRHTTVKVEKNGVYDVSNICKALYSLKKVLTFILYIDALTQAHTFPDMFKDSVLKPTCL